MGKWLSVWCGCELKRRVKVCEFYLITPINNGMVFWFRCKTSLFTFTHSRTSSSLCCCWCCFTKCFRFRCSSLRYYFNSFFYVSHMHNSTLSRFTHSCELYAGLIHQHQIIGFLSISLDFRFSRLVLCCLSAPFLFSIFFYSRRFLCISYCFVRETKITRWTEKKNEKKMKKKNETDVKPDRDRTA